MIRDGVEVVLIRCHGGPGAGTRFVPLTDLGGARPPPEELPSPAGRYVRQNYSRLPRGDHPNVCRGADYRWEG